MEPPVISLVVLTYGSLELSKACVESLRSHTDLSHELIIVDNGSTPDAAEWANEVADRVVINSDNRGFAVGMNQGLAIATGELVAFVNNDTLFPADWASTIAETMRDHPRAGIVAPAVTAAGNPATVRSEPGGDPVVFEPFGHLPSGVVYVMRTDLARELGGWNEDYHLATGEDLDLLFTVWSNELEVILEPKVLVEHVSRASRKTVPGMREVELANLQHFIDRWKRGDSPPIRVPTCPPEHFGDNLRHAAAAATWLERLVDARRVDPASSGGRAQVAQLDREIARLRSRLDNEQAKFAGLMRRRSVRVALGAARLAAPILQLTRRRGPLEPERRGEELRVAEQMCSLRPSHGPAVGPLVSVVVLNRNGEVHLERLLHGLAQNTTYRSFELVVVDNDSTDGSRSLLVQDWGYPTKLIANEENVTFSAGCNQGLAAASGPYTLLLNNDISPINPGWLGAMVGALEADRQLGAVGAVLVYPERPGYRSKDPNTGADLTVQHRGIHFRWRRTDDPGGVVPWGYNMGVGEDPTDPALVTRVDVPAATAACLLVRTELLRDLGGLDERYVYGVEDVELCLRIRRSGRRIAVVGDAALHHHEFGTQSKTAAELKRATGLVNLQHFAETWGPELSRMLDLEALDPEHQPLRQRNRPLTMIVVEDTTSSEPTSAHALEASLTGFGHSVIIRDSTGVKTHPELSVLICTSPSFDIRQVPHDVLTVAWIGDRLDLWFGMEWFRSYRVHVPGSTAIARELEAGGTPATDVVCSTNATALEAAIRRFLQQPRIALNVDDEDSVRVGEELAVALVQCGARVVVRHRLEWDTPASQCVDAVVMLADAAHYIPRPSHVNVLRRQTTRDGESVPGYDRVVPDASIDAREMVDLVSGLLARRSTETAT